MTLATQVKRIADSKPFYALAGVGDFAVERTREYASTVQGKAETVARDFPEKAREYADAATTRFTRFYDDLAVRGRRIVSKVTGETALELEDVSERAEPAAAPAPTGETAARRPAGTRAKTTTQS
ncbi:hypothetical protein [Sphaerimonospora thailandensis]|uniref:Uncharacterized protein n=1 Tax=Sphaerimonospora thailandensis TaxID=795644 RepID=A0A8J3REU1_9ACTN|nr:hypothetical protein [Sphaerimonospora thailandensis]GIH73410.1 hypothetical protein Mth01_56630 [Sphaerimonospora thailandensis]